MTEQDLEVTPDPQLEGVEVEPDDAHPSPMWKVAVVFCALGAGVIALLSGVGGDAFVYSKMVHEVTANPDGFVGREIRVEGDLVPGSIEHRDEPCEWRFEIEKQGEVLPVRFGHCVVPDTFRDGFGISVVAQGELDEDHVFIASDIIPRCPSKYEMQQRLESGEEMPHLMPAADGGAAPQLGLPAGDEGTP